MQPPHRCQSMVVAPMLLFLSSLATANASAATVDASVPGFVSAGTQVTVDPAGEGLPYDGHGGLSAGASSRLLFDYAPAVRDEILDYLYKPKFGANLWVCKVEIGGDTQSTDGTEPSHMHTRDDLNCTRGCTIPRHAVR